MLTAGMIFLCVVFRSKSNGRGGLNRSGGVSPPRQQQTKTKSPAQFRSRIDEYYRTAITGRDI